jgi:hypothetical protein
MLSYQNDIFFCFFFLFLGTNKLPAHLEHFNQPEIEEVITYSYPGTPHRSQENSRSSTPAFGGPSTPSDRKRKKRRSPDPDIATENNELGVKPLVGVFFFF